MLLFNLSNRLEEVRDPVEPFLFGFLRKFCVHIGPLEVFAGSGIRKVDSGGRYTVVQQLKPDLRMFPLVAGGLQEKVRNLYKPFLLCLGGIIGVFVGRLGFTRKGGHQVGFGFGALQIVHVNQPLSAIFLPPCSGRCFPAHAGQNPSNRIW